VPCVPNPPPCAPRDEDRESIRARLRAALRDRFGLSDFRPGQEDVLVRVMNGRNVLAIFPAGHGKSLLYQLPAALLPGLTIVFSPLVALMHEQQSILTRRYGIASISLTHVLREMNPSVFFSRLADVRRGQYKVVFLSPERLDDDRVMAILREQTVSLAVLDEAHCISTWGHDFRPHYRRLLRFIGEVRPAVVLALTATAPPPVEADILRQIGGPAEVFRASPHLPNLRLHVIGVAGEGEKLACLARIIPRLKGNGIVYCGTHEECENVADFLNARGIGAAAYHAGLGPRRTELEQDFLLGRWKAVAATCALGMGINKRDLRFVIHYRLPGSPELYYQEIGRAGRDGERADAVLLFDPADRSLQEFFLRTTHAEPADYGTVFRVLDAATPKSPDAIAGMAGLARTLVEVIAENLVDAGLARRERIVEEGKFVAWGYCAAGAAPAPAAIEPFLAARRGRVQALGAMLHYGQAAACLMQYLCRYLGAPDTQPCGQCTHCRDYARHYDAYRAPMPEADAFLAARLPRLDACRWHDGGFALDFHAGTKVGEALSRTKYGRHEPPDWLLERAADCVREKFRGQAGHIVQALTFIPPAADRPLVQSLAETIAARAGIPCLALLARARPTDFQKDMRTRGEKQRNTRGAFALRPDAPAPPGTLLLLDDIYDSGWTLREAARVIRERFPSCRIHIFTLTRTHHNDDY